MDLLATYIGTAKPAHPSQETPSHLSVKCEALLSGEMSKRDAQTRLMVAYHLIRQNPSLCAPQVVAALLLQKAGVTHHMLETWQALHNRFPTNREVMRNLLNWLTNSDREEEAAALIEAFFDGLEMSLADHAEQAEFYAKLSDQSHSDALFRDLIEKDSNNPLPRIVFGKNLFARGDIMGAFSVLDPIRRADGAEAAHDIIKATDRAIIAMETISPQSSRGNLTAPLALRNALSLFAERKLRPLDSNALGPVVFAAGTLGESKSDERMLRLAGRMNNGPSLGGINFTKPIEIVCVNEVESRQWSGFMSAYQSMGLQIRQIDEFEAEPTLTPPQGAELLTDLLTLLPRLTRKGIERLVPHFQATRPDMVSIWSEEAMLPFTLAALVAQVPNLVINLRSDAPKPGSPENDTRYSAIYHALLAIPGVTLTTPSRIKAQGYAQWLDVDVASFTVLPDPTFFDVESFGRDQNLMWQSYEIATAGTNLTLAIYAGQDDSASSAAWIERTKSALERHQDLRILMLSSEQTASDLRHQAKELGLGPRLLVVGESGAAASWLERSDIFTTLDTTPNAQYLAAQAQTLGLPLITLDSPHLHEIFEDGVTGLGISDTDDKTQFDTALDRLIDSGPRRKLMCARAREFAEHRYSANQVLAKLLQTALGLPVKPVSLAQVGDAPNLYKPERQHPRPGAVSDIYRVISQDRPASRNSA